jgi:hypothetical protein
VHLDKHFEDYPKIFDNLQIFDTIKFKNCSIAVEEAFVSSYQNTPYPNLKSMGFIQSTSSNIIVDKVILAKNFKNLVKINLSNSPTFNNKLISFLAKLNEKCALTKLNISNTKVDC